MSALLRAMSPLVLASELAWGDEGDANDGGHDAGALSPVALRPLSRMSEEEKQVPSVPFIVATALFGLNELSTYIH